MRLAFLARRLGFYLAAAAAAIGLNFLLPRLMPGDPSSAIVEELERVSGQQVPAETLMSIRAIFGNPSDNLAQQFADYVRQLAHGDLGVSVVNFPVPVADLVWQALPWTLLLVGATTVTAFAIGTLLGVVAGWKAGSRFESLCSPSGCSASSSAGPRCPAGTTPTCRRDSASPTRSACCITECCPQQPSCSRPSVGGCSGCGT
jgi:peptide/nickel transport system permease protein